MSTAVWRGEKRPLPPPWLAYPFIERMSIGWRMGSGESYLDRLRAWQQTLSADDLSTYRSLFPPPVLWAGYWDEKESDDDGQADDDERLFFKDEFWVDLWRPAGTPKYTRQMFSLGQPIDMCVFSMHGDNACFALQFEVAFWYHEERGFCVEQLLVAEKAEFMGDSQAAKSVRGAKSLEDVRHIENGIANADRELWDQYQYSVMLNLNWSKFSQNRALRQALLATGEAVLVCHDSDSVWGTGLAPESPDVRDPQRWSGHNLLGFALMEVRDELRRVFKHEDLCDWSGIKRE